MDKSKPYPQCYTREELEEHLMGWRGRAYCAEKFISRLLGIDLNQAVQEADRRLNHPLGKDEEWDGSRTDWDEANIVLLKGALARLEHNVQVLGADPKTGCQCAECRNVVINLDATPPDIEGHKKPKAEGGYIRVAPDGKVLG